MTASASWSCPNRASSGAADAAVHDTIVWSRGDSARNHSDAAMRSRAGRLLGGGLTVMTLLLGGARFVDGVYVPAQKEVSAA